MEIVLCPKCRTETDATKHMCQWCGKYLIITELSREDQKIIRGVWNRGEFELQNPVTKSTYSEDLSNPTSKKDGLFSELSPLSSIDLKDKPPDVPIKRRGTKSEIIPSIKKQNETKPEFIKKSKLLKSVHEDFELFGDLDSD